MTIYQNSPISPLMSNIGANPNLGKPSQPEMPPSPPSNKTNNLDGTLGKKFVLKVQAYSALEVMWDNWETIGDLDVWNVLLLILGMPRWSAAITDASNLRLGKESSITQSDVAITLQFTRKYEALIKAHFCAFLEKNKVKFEDRDYSTKGMIYNLFGDRGDVNYLLNYTGPDDR